MRESVYLSVNWCFQRALVRGGGLQLCVTLLAAGFVIGSSGASVRDITQHTGAAQRHPLCFPGARPKAWCFHIHAEASLSHGAQAENLVPPCTRRSVSLSISLSLIVCS